MSRLKPPYQYVMDTSALIDLNKNYPRQIFKGLWDRFDEMCRELLVVCPREVLIEIKRQDDELRIWAVSNETIFLEPMDDEIIIFQQVMAVYPAEIIAKFSTGPWADPFVIACAKFYNLPIIQHETNDRNQYKIPPIAKRFNVDCIRLVQFFLEEGWEFSS